MTWYFHPKSHVPQVETRYFLDVSCNQQSGETDDPTDFCEHAQSNQELVHAQRVLEVRVSQNVHKTHLAQHLNTAVVPHCDPSMAQLSYEARFDHWTGPLLRGLVLITSSYETSSIRCSFEDSSCPSQRGPYHLTFHFRAFNILEVHFMPELVHSKDHQQPFQWNRELRICVFSVQTIIQTTCCDLEFQSPGHE